MNVKMSEESPGHSPGPGSPGRSPTRGKYCSSVDQAKEYMENTGCFGELFFFSKPADE